MEKPAPFPPIFPLIGRLLPPSWARFQGSRVDEAFRLSPLLFLRSMYLLGSSLAVSRSYELPFSLKFFFFSMVSIPYVQHLFDRLLLASVHCRHLVDLFPSVGLGRLYGYDLSKPAPSRRHWRLKLFSKAFISPPRMPSPSFRDPLSFDTPDRTIQAVPFFSAHPGSSLFRIVSAATPNSSFVVVIRVNQSSAAHSVPPLNPGYEAVSLRATTFDWGTFFPHSFFHWGPLLCRRGRVAGPHLGRDSD